MHFDRKGGFQKRADVASAKALENRWQVPDEVPVSIGQLPLEHLDLVVDLRSRSLIGNPAHGGEHVYELY